MKNLRTLTRKFGPVVAGAGALVMGASAHAVDPVDAAAALGTLSGSITGFGPVLFGLALASTVIMIGVSWIKKGRGAAK